MSLVLVCSLCFGSSIAFLDDPFGQGIQLEGASTYGAIVNEGCVLTWDDFEIGSNVTGATRIIPAGNYTFKGVASGAVNSYSFGGGKLDLWGTGLDAPAGEYLSGPLMQLSEGVYAYHSSLKGTLRVTFWINITPDTTGTPVWITPNSILCEVYANGKVIESQQLQRVSNTSGDFALNLSFTEQQIQRVVFKMQFPQTASSKLPADWYRYAGMNMYSTIRWDGTTSESDAVNDMVDGINQGNQLQAESNGLLSRIIESITSLPSKIADAIKGLFIPDEKQIDIIRGKWQEFLTTKMGFIYQMFQWIDTFFEGIIDNLSGSDSGAFEIPAFPAFEAGGQTVQLWSEPLTVDFSDNAFVQTLQPIACPFILGVTAYHLWFAMSDLMECFLAGKSYRDFSHRRDSE